MMLACASPKAIASLIASIALLQAVAAIPAPALQARAGAFLQQNGLDAQKLNSQFATLTPTSSCTDGTQVCVNGQFGQCVGGKITGLTACSGGTSCVALPLQNKPGTSVTCDTQADAISRINTATGGTGGLTGNGQGAAGSAQAPASSSAPAGNAGANVAAAVSSAAPAASSASTASTSGAAADFKEQNKLDAQKLNAQFASLTAGSSCTDGQQACVQGSFAQCVGGKFQMTACSGGTQCFALPLVNKAGTSIGCDAQADAVARGGLASGGGAAANNGATGGASASAGNAAASAPAPANNLAAAAPSSAAAAGSAADFKEQNKIDAQKLNAQFASLTAGSTCTDGQQACVQGSFAQCVGGKFQMSACSGGTQCFALPLVNKAGTSVSCDTRADAVSRGGLTA